MTQSTINKKKNRNTMKAAIIFTILAVIAAPVAVLGEYEEVKDVNGNPVIAEKPYYIIFSDEWVSYYGQDDSTPCPQFAVVSIDPLRAPRQPVLIYLESPPSLSSGQDHVLEHTEVRFKFQKMDDSCPGQTGIWKPTTWPRIRVNGTMESEEGTFKLSRANMGYWIELGYGEHKVVMNEHELDEFGYEIDFLGAQIFGYGPQFRFEPVKM
ncbi:hypothetical protein Bca4012_057525 [Brassica carinata]